MIVGVDEAGRGPLAGVVTGCALYLKIEPPFEVKDSKELTPAAREKIFDWLLRNSVFSLALATPKEIDSLNILQATFLTFDRAIQGLLAKAPYLTDAQFIIDGNLFSTSLGIRYACMEKADKYVKAVSCASIMAKVSRDHLMRTADFLYPEWGFFQHKGYPTRRHFLLAKTKKLTPLHRRSFYPCTGNSDER